MFHWEVLITYFFFVEALHNWFHFPALYKFQPSTLIERYLFFSCCQDNTCLYILLLFLKNVLKKPQANSFFFFFYLFFFYSL